MQNYTFGISRDITEQLINEAKGKIEKYKQLQPATIQEIDYLNSEILVVSSFIKYHEIQSEREKEVCGLFRYQNEYGASLDTPELMIDAAHNRLTELTNRLDSYSERQRSLENKIEFLEKDIELLNHMLKSSPRAAIIEAGVPPLI